MHRAVFSAYSVWRGSEGEYGTVSVYMEIYHAA